MGDTDNNLIESFARWKDELFRTAGTIVESSVADAIRKKSRGAIGDFHIAVENCANAKSEHSMPNPPCGREKGSWCKILANDELQSRGSPRSTRHIEIELKRGRSYKTVGLFVSWFIGVWLGELTNSHLFAIEQGWYLGVAPSNNPKEVAALVARLGIDPHGTVMLRETTASGRHAHLPFGQCGMSSHGETL